MTREAWDWSSLRFLIAMSRPSRAILLITGVWLAALGVGLWLDAPVARLAYRAAIDRDHFGNHLMKMGGDWRFTLAVALALIAWHRNGLRITGLLALSAIVGGVLYTLMKWSAGRQRPVVAINPFAFSPFRNGFEGFLNEPNLSFPSGHTCLAFATAATLAICIPRWRYLFYGLAAVVGVERVAENAHYLTDVIAGAGLGVLSSHLTYWWMHRLVGARDAGVARLDSESGKPTDENAGTVVWARAAEE
jgi:membrane-associated phospholipid phosphatase